MKALAGVLVSDLVDRHESLDEEAYSCHLEVGAYARQAAVVWIEPLELHAERIGPRWGSLVDDGGHLLPGVEGALVDRLANLLPASAAGSVINTVDDYAEADRPAVRIEIATNYHDGETFDRWFDRVGWPVVATLRNITDPGTFNSPYLFSGLGSER